MERYFLNCICTWCTLPIPPGWITFLTMFT